MKKMPMGMIPAYLAVVLAALIVHGLFEAIHAALGRCCRDLGLLRFGLPCVT
jgi:hypothetical protein